MPSSRAWSKVKDPRFKQILTSLVKHLHAFAREVELTEEEWFEGIKFLTAVGQKCDDKRQEFILLSDILGLSSLVDMINHRLPDGATASTVLGPFFVHGAPEFANDADLTKGAKIPGEHTLVAGRITSIDGKPVANATVDVWQARANGVYDIQDPDRRVRAARADQGGCRRALRVPHVQADVLRRADRRAGRDRAGQDGAPSDAPGAPPHDRRRAGLPAGDHARVRQGRPVPRVRHGVRGQALARRRVQEGSTRRTRRSGSASRTRSCGSTGTSSSRPRAPARPARRSPRATR